MNQDANDHSPVTKGLQCRDDYRSSGRFQGGIAQPVLRVGLFSEFVPNHDEVLLPEDGRPFSLMPREWPSGCPANDADDLGAVQRAGRGISAFRTLLKRSPSPKSGGLGTGFSGAGELGTIRASPEIGQRINKVSLTIRNARLAAATTSSGIIWMYFQFLLYWPHSRIARSNGPKLSPIAAKCES